VRLYGANFLCHDCLIKKQSYYIHERLVAMNERDNNSPTRETGEYWHGVITELAGENRKLAEDGLSLTNEIRANEIRAANEIRTLENEKRELEKRCDELNKKWQDAIYQSQESINSLNRNICRLQKRIKYRNICIGVLVGIAVGMLVVMYILFNSRAFASPEGVDTTISNVSYLLDSNMSPPWYVLENPVKLLLW